LQFPQPGVRSPLILRLSLLRDSCESTHSYTPSKKRHWRMDFFLPKKHWRTNLKAKWTLGDKGWAHNPLWFVFTDMNQLAISTTRCAPTTYPTAQFALRFVRNPLLHTIQKRHWRMDFLPKKHWRTNLEAKWTLEDTGGAHNPLWFVFTDMNQLAIFTTRCAPITYLTAQFVPRFVRANPLLHTIKKKHWRMDCFFLKKHWRTTATSIPMGHMSHTSYFLIELR
jgi:hypothetical protein